ncbi:MAG: O-methyltransferase [Candidatus Paceibacterota bacterium]|jgi:caffeoyl-CoA O-methyltransferase
MTKRLYKKAEMNDSLSLYVEELHANAEDKVFLDVVDETWEREHSFLQIPLSEAKFLSLFVKATKAKKVLEVGTFRGWSAAWITRALPQNGKLFTIDHDVRVESEARELWKKLLLTEKIDFKITKATEGLGDFKEKGEKFDLIFIDAGKSEYKEYLDLAYEILDDGGVLLADNTLWAGQAADTDAESKAKYMQEFNEYVFQKFKGQACLIPAWDGVVMVVK